MARDEKSGKSEEEKEFLHRLKKILYGENGPNNAPAKEDHSVDETDVDHEDEPKS